MPQSLRCVRGTGLRQPPRMTVNRKSPRGPMRRSLAVPPAEPLSNELDRVVEVAGIITGCPAGDRWAQSVVATPLLM
jgi:hypothetical protein